MSTINVYEYPSDPKELPAYRIAVMQAALEGKPVQTAYPKDYPYLSWDWMDTAAPSWDWYECVYRIDPAFKPKVLTPWNVDNCPVGAQVRHDKGYDRCLIISATSTAFYMRDNRFWTYGDAAKLCEHSIDGGKSWLPCGTYE